MAEEKNKVEEKKVGNKKSEEVKKKIPSEEKKQESKPAVSKNLKSEKKKEAVVELEREYVIPLRKKIANVPRYRRAKKAIKGIKEFLAKHMRVEGRDLNKVKIDIHLNNEVWFRGIKKPLHKVKVKAVKKDGIVYVELAELPKVVQFAKARLEKRAKSAGVSVKTPKSEIPKEEDKDGDGVDDKKEEAEDKKATTEKAAKVEKAAVKAEKHTAKGAHTAKVAPVRKSLKK